MEKEKIEKIRNWELKALTLQHRLKKGDKLYLISLDGKYCQGLSIVPDFALEYIQSVYRLDSEDSSQAQVISEMVFDGDKLTFIQHLDSIMLKKGK